MADSYRAEGKRLARERNQAFFVIEIDGRTKMTGKRTALLRFSGPCDEKFERKIKAFIAEAVRKDEPPPERRDVEEGL